jgi:hypothetical protein
MITLAVALLLGIPALAGNVDLLTDLESRLWSDPATDGALTEVCVNDQCVTVDKRDIGWRIDKQKPMQSQPVDLIADIVDRVSSKADFGGRVSVTYETNVKVDDKGRNEYTKIQVEVSAGNGKAAQAAAGN